MIYIASPYTQQEGEHSTIVYSRYEAVTDYCTYLMHYGEIFYAPITFTHNWAIAQNLPTDANFWGAFNTHYMNLCDELHVLMLPGWETSKGVQHEIKFFTDRGRPIKYIRSGYIESARTEIR